MFKKIKLRHWLMAVCALLVIAAAVAANLAFRAKRSYSLLRDWQAQIRHQAANGGTIGSAPAAKTFEPAYLNVVFGEETNLLEHMKVLIAKGIAEDPSLNLGEVTAMVATYSKLPDGSVEDVAIHVFGGFAVGKRRPGFNRDGYFAAQLDRNLWDTGNSMISLMGRDMIVFADPKTSTAHDKILESILSGDILPLVDSITNKPLHFAAVFPDPRRVLPTQLRPHISACIFKGHLAPHAGAYEWQLLTKNAQSAGYTLNVINDLKLAATIGLRTRFDGVVHKTAWGNHVSTWWAFQMAQTLDEAALQMRQTTISMNTKIQRPMVNASLKTVERFGRDMAVMRMIRDERLDPRLADERMKSGKPLNYWSEQHKWGPDWPVARPNTNGTPATAPAPAASVAPATSPTT